MLTICSVKDFKTNVSDYNFLIVRSMLYEIPNVKQLIGLAPSEELFLRTLDEKKINQNWFEKFTKDFNKERKQAAYKYNLHFIKDLIKSGKSVTLMCYCDTMQCHRVLVAEDFRNLEIEVHLL